MLGTGALATRAVYSAPAVRDPVLPRLLERVYRQARHLPLEEQEIFSIFNFLATSCLFQKATTTALSELHKIACRQIVLVSSLESFSEGLPWWSIG